MMTCGNQNGQDTEMEGEGELNIVLFSLNKHTHSIKCPPRKSANPRP